MESADKCIWTEKVHTHEMKSFYPNTTCCPAHTPAFKKMWFYQTQNELGSCKSRDRAGAPQRSVCSGSTLWPWCFFQTRSGPELHSRLAQSHEAASELQCLFVSRVHIITDGLHAGLLTLSIRSCPKDTLTHEYHPKSKSTNSWHGGDLHAKQPFPAHEIKFCAPFTGTFCALQSWLQLTFKGMGPKQSGS